MDVVLSPAGGGHCLALHRSLQRLYQEKHLRTFTPMPGAEEVWENEINILLFLNCYLVVAQLLHVSFVLIA
jgi:hypothetical protein